MLMMFKDILRTLIFTLVPGLIFAFLVMSALPTFKKSGFKNTIKGFFKSLKNKDHLFLFLLLIYFFIVIYRTLFQRDFSYDSLSDVFGGWKIFKTQYTGLDYQVIGNIAMFFPFGLLWTLTFEREEKSVKTLLITLLSSLCFSAFIEITQLIFSKGTFQFSDIVYNTLGGVLGAPAGQLGRAMCVPYGKILSDEIVPNTVTKTLHVDKTFAPDGSSFSVPAYPGYDTVRNQVRTIKAFRRPVILVDDLLHNGYRLDKLSPVFAAEELEIRTVVVGILSARGRDLMEVQGRQVECEYFIPNLHYWVTESLLYPFLGGDSVGTPAPGRMLPSINLILPYYYPRHYVGTTDAAIRDLSRTALENTLSILHALEQAHQEQFSTALTLRRLGEALYRPRLPDRGRSLRYDLSLPASACLEDDLLRLDRIRMRGGMIHGA